MKLSEAIRLGAMLKPQGAEFFVNGAGATCALGAAMDACGKLSDRLCDSDVEAIFPITVERVWHPLVKSKFPREVAEIVISLNDEHHWTREQIADWVESIEAQHEPQVEQPQPVSVEVS